MRRSCLGSDASRRYGARVGSWSYHLPFFSSLILSDSATHFVYYTKRTFMQALSPHFMRVFLPSLWKRGINSGDSPPVLTEGLPIRLFPPVKAQHGVALPQLALSPQRAKLLARVKVLIVFGNDQSRGVKKPRLG